MVPTKTSYLSRVALTLHALTSDARTSGIRISICASENGRIPEGPTNTAKTQRQVHLQTNTHHCPYIAITSWERSPHLRMTASPSPDRKPNPRAASTSRACQNKSCKNSSCISLIGRDTSAYARGKHVPARANMLKRVFAISCTSGEERHNSLALVCSCTTPMRLRVC